MSVIGNVETRKEAANEPMSKMSTVARKELLRVSQIVSEKRKEIEEMQQLMGKLEDLPKKLQHHILVPFGNVGFMPGRIVKTNELMVLLGDGYFVDKSCYETIELLQRRKKVLEDFVEQAVSEKKSIEQQLSLMEQIGSSQGNGEVEIREPYDENAEKEFRLKRKKMLSKNHNSAPSNVDSDKELMDRLNELELLEKEEEELATAADVIDQTTEPAIEETSEPPTGVSKEEYARLMETLMLLSSEDEEDEEEEDEEDDVAVEKSNQLDSDDLSCEEEEEEKIVKSVPKKTKKKYVRFASTNSESAFKADDPVSQSSTVETNIAPVASILRNKEYKSPVNHNAIRPLDYPVIKETSNDAFSGVIVEKNMQSPQEQSTDSLPPKRASQFKMKRLKQNDN